MSNRARYLAFIIAALGVLLFSTKAVIIKLAYRYDIDSISLLLLRMLFALPFYLAIWGYHYKEWRQDPLSKKQVITLIFLGLFGYYLASYFDFQGLTYITASLERLILFTYPTFVLILSALFLKKKITKTQLISIGITYTGIVVIFFDRDGITAGDPQEVLFGSLLIVISAITYAAYLVGANSLIEKVGSVRLTTFSLLISCSAVITHYLITTDLQLFHYPKEVYLLSFVMAIFSTVIPSFLINEAIKRIGAPSVSIIGSLGPVSTILLSVAFLGEMLTFTQVIGALIIISGIFVIGRAK